MTETEPQEAPATADGEPEESTPEEAKGVTLPPTELTDDPLFETLWAKVLTSWDDDKIHASILEYSVGAERLPDLAGRYRLLKEDPTKGPRAQKRLDAIILAATQLMMSMKTPTNRAVPLSITLTVAGIMACGVLFVAYALFRR